MAVGNDILDISALQESAANGDAAAQYSLGWHYAKGTAVGLDLAEAEKWFLKAAERGNANALYSLGVMANNRKMSLKPKNGG
jgi:TPR repeat protein